MGACCRIAASNPIHKECANGPGQFYYRCFSDSLRTIYFIKQSCKIRRGGFTPALSDEEVITIKICGEYFKLECDKDIFAYFHAHYRHFFRSSMTGLCLSAKLRIYGKSKQLFKNG
ncbi:MAG: hypothetical protein ACTFAK_16050 [Candidatus Electronema sp. VV]